MFDNNILTALERTSLIASIWTVNIPVTDKMVVDTVSVIACKLVPVACSIWMTLRKRKFEKQKLKVKWLL